MLHAEDQILVTITGFGVHRQRLLGKTFGANDYFVISSHLDAHGKIAARIGNGLPAEFFLGGAANAQLGPGQRETFLSEDGTANKKVVGMAPACLIGILF